MKKIMSFLLISVMTFGLLSGCSRKSVATPLPEYETNTVTEMETNDSEAVKEMYCVPEYEEFDEIIPKEYCERKLTDAELEALGYNEILEVREKISTVGDALAWLGLLPANCFSESTLGTLWSYENNLDKFFYPSVPDIFNFADEFGGGYPWIGPDNASLIAAWLVQDDIEGASVFCSNYTEAAWMRLCLPAEDGYYLVPASASISVLHTKGIGGIDAQGNHAIFNKTIKVKDIFTFAEYLGTLSPKAYSSALIDDFEQKIEITTDQQATALGYNTENNKLHYITLRSGINVLCDPEGLFVGDSSQIGNLSNLQFEVDDFQVPDGFGSPTLSYERAVELNGLTLDEAAAEVNTISDVITYLYAGCFEYLSVDICVDDGAVVWHFNQTAETVNMTKGPGCGGTANLVTKLLWGDYDEVGFVCHTYKEGGGHVYNYVRCGDIYCVFDMTSITAESLTSGMCYDPMNFFAVTCSDLKEYSRDVGFKYGYPPVVYAYCAEQEIPLAWSARDGCSVTWYPKDTELLVIQEDRENGYRIEYREISDSIVAKIEAGRKNFCNNTRYLRTEVKPKLNLTSDLAGETISYEELQSVVWNSTPEELAEKIHTVEDAILLFHAAGYRFGGEDITEDEWHFNHYAEKSLYRAANGCGQVAAMTRYLLEGDYDEVGYMCTTLLEGNGGGHVFNYILTNGNYYVFDLTKYISNDYYEPNGNAVIKVGRDLNDFADCINKLYSSHKESVGVIYSYSLLREIPIAWEGTVKTTGLPIKYEIDVNILYENEGLGYSIKFVPLSDDEEALINEKRK